MTLKVKYDHKDPRVHVKEFVLLFFSYSSSLNSRYKAK